MIPKAIAFLPLVAFFLASCAVGHLHQATDGAKVGVASPSGHSGGARYFRISDKGVLYAQLDLVTEAFCSETLVASRTQAPPPGTVKYECSLLDAGPELPFKARLRDEKLHTSIDIAGKTEALCRVAMSVPTATGGKYTTAVGSCRQSN
jgi:hypothetical protein